MKKFNNIITFSSFNKFPGLICGISTRHFGDMRSIDNLNSFLNNLQIPLEQTVGMEQRHTANIKILDTAKRKMILRTDGLVTNKNNIFLYVITADCLPIIFYDPKNRIVGNLHAGYKGLSDGILSQMIIRMNRLGCDIPGVKVGIGPGIGVCCYNVPKERIELFREKFTDYFKIINGTYFLDLKKIAVQELMQQGIKEANIEVSAICTKENIDMFYSNRGDTQETFGEFATVIGMF